MSHAPYTIRLAIQSDVPAMLAIYGPFVEHTYVSFETEVPTASAFWQRVQAVLAEAPWLVCTHEDQVIGYAYASAHRSRQAYQWNRELSVYVEEAWRGKGIATSLYSTLIELLKLQGYLNTLIGISLPNETSVRFHEKMGFRPVGIYHNIGFKKGRFCDVGWWELVIQNTSPKEIIPISICQKMNIWQEILLNGTVNLL